MIDSKKIHANIPRYERNRNSMMAQRGGKGKNRELDKLEGIQKLVKGREVVLKYRGRRTFAEAVSMVKEAPGPSGSSLVNFFSNAEDRYKLSKAFVGVVLLPGSSYNIQTHFEMEGVFTIKVTSMGENLCLLEDLEEGYIRELIGEVSTWWKQWFKEIKPWRFSDVDEERVVWLRIYGVPCQA